MKLLGVALVILGTAAVIFGGIGYNRQGTVLDVCGINAAAPEHMSVPFPPIAGATALIGGVAFLAAEKRYAEPRDELRPD